MSSGCNNEKGQVRGLELRRRYFVLGLSVVLTIALAVPALGGPSNPVASISASAKSIAYKALRRANAANRAAKKAQTTANTALSTANTAQSTAVGAQASANTAQSTAVGAKTAADNAQTSANAAQATANSKFGTTAETFGTATANNNTSPKSNLAGCPSGSSLTGGGYNVGGTDPNQVTVTLSESYINSWDVQARAISGFTPTWSLVAAAQCASP